MEKPDLRKLDGEVAQQDQFGAFPLLLRRGQFMLGIKESAKRKTPCKAQNASI
jgi:hypothetical protein